LSNEPETDCDVPHASERAKTLGANQRKAMNMATQYPLEDSRKAEEAQIEIRGLVERARAAQAQIRNLGQEDVRRIAAAIGWLAVTRAEVWGETVLAETGMGRVVSKVNRTRDRARGLMRDYQTAKTVGVIETDPEKGLVKIAKPVGVVAALIPTTVPEGVVFMGAMNAIMGRNAMICSPHPRAKFSTNFVVNDIRELLGRMDVPRDLVLCIEKPSLYKTGELMRHSDLVVATGGAPMVKAAYSSGTPAFGVGAGNAVVVIDETADVYYAADQIAHSQMNDFAIGCSTENAIVVHDSVYDEMLKAIDQTKGYRCSAEEKKLLQRTLWVDGHLNPEVLSKPASFMAEKSGFTIPEDRDWLVVEETGYGPAYPFSGEKLSVVVAMYRFRRFEEAIDLVNNIHAYSGAGHSCGIYTADEDRIRKYAESTHTVRVAVGQATTRSNAGGWTTGMPFTINLGCGTWGGNIASENITWRHYINTTWVARPIEPKVPSDSELFGSVLDETELFKNLPGVGQPEVES